ncbi:hypothetical protein PVAND_006785 [Polypedilum vanderplanki]|uniref:FAD-binding PCMH-type domain-containing protein n=1 Tax=Polypedilum vanderplanki TaxID=319348 RepID=A0A9J6C4P7_POLVA|nr:hypothetical protein PVAND_006785 [Polypedilum vanderplanki]
MEEVENSFGGNICRCTGYRPILDAFKSLAIDADKNLLDACKDIEDLSDIKMCPKSGNPCSGQMHLHYHNEIFKIFETIGEKPYILIGGNTAHGVYRRSTDLKVFVDISSVEELKAYQVTENSLEIGGAVTLTEAMEIFTKVANENKNFQYLHEIVKHFDLIANVPVRNNGTLAGNLMIKNAHNEFPSDIFICFEAIGTMINIWDGSKNEIQISLNHFISTDMNKKVLTKITLPAIDPVKFFYRSYKIMPRAQNAHAYVNAIFVQLNDSKVISAKICFGGIDPKFVHATNTETFLIGENLFENSTLQRALAILNDELKPDWVLPDASPEYRKNLALALFYKFILNIAPNEKVVAKFKSGGEILKRDLSSGTQTFDTYKQNWPLTKNIPKIEADIQCTGEAKYINDHPPLPNELHAAFVTAKNVHGEILNIDASKALKMPGVVAFFSAKDIPGTNTFMPPNYLFVSEPEEIFCSSKVLFYNQPVGVIVAKTFELANKAADMITITYVEDNNKSKVMTSIMEVKDDKLRTLICPEYSVEGQQGDNIQHSESITGNFHFDSQYHYTMETQSCLCIPIEDGIDVYSSTQWMDATQIAVAETLLLPNNAVNMKVRRLGGGFGSKISRPAQIACASALAAYLLNRPVRFVMTMEANMNVFGKRLPCYSEYKVEVDKNGRILKLRNEYIEDYGCSFNEPAYLTTGFFNNCYDNKYFNVIAKKAKTDKASNTWCRGPGTLEGIAMIENIMEHISRKVNRDPIDVRLENIPKESVIKKLLKEFIQKTNYHDRKKEITNYNLNNRWIKRGIAIVPIKFHIEYFGSLHALVSIYHRDGSVSVTVGGIEMGQGLNTKVAQTAAYALGIPLEKVSVKPSNTLTAPNAIVTGGSIGSEISCHAIKKACDILNERLKPIKEQNTDSNWNELIEKAYVADVDLSANYMYKSADVEEYQVWGASCCELEVDILTGNILIKRVDIMEDVGESLSPGIDIGQIEGGFVMGLGYWLTENLIYDRITGELLTNRSWNYKPPGAKDIPIDFRISFLSKSSNPFGVLRSKAVGEPPLVASVVVLFALRHALDSARNDSGRKNDEYYQLDAPATSEKIFLTANNKPEMFLLS